MPTKMGYMKQGRRGYGGGGKKMMSPLTGPGKNKATTHSKKYSIPKKGKMMY